MADDREIDYILAFLKLDPPTAVRPTIQNDTMLIEYKTHPSAEFDSKFDFLTSTIKKEVVLTLKSVALNYMDLHKSTFYDRCVLCKDHGYMSICLLCGDSFCTRACTKREENTESTSSLP